MDNNMEFWNQLKEPPPEALKPIQGGRLKGKTDVNPQWRYKAMTDLFGPCGIGWKYTIEKLWMEPVEQEVCAFAQIALSIKVEGEWSETIPGVGGSMLVAKETSGLHVSDEAYKMAITDALSVALKMIGVAADIYAGLLDSKHSSGPGVTSQKTQAKATPAGKPATAKADGKPEEEKTEPPQNGTKQPPALKNIGELYTRAGKFGLSPRDVCEANGVGKGDDITDFNEAWIKTATKFQAAIMAKQGSLN